MKFPKRMDTPAIKDFGVMQSLKNFFSRLGKASEIRLQRLTDQVKRIADRLRGLGEEEPRGVTDQLEDLKEEADEFNAVRNFVEKLPPGLSQPQYFNLALDLLRKLGRAEEAMDLHGLYTFKYVARTKGKYYDVFPVIMFNSVGSTYFRGFNFHWERAPEYVESVNRTYSFFGVKSRFYRIKPHELEHFLQIPTFMPIFIPQ